MKLILNEQYLLRQSLDNQYIDKEKPINTIRILAKYFLSIGMNKPQTISSIDDFMNKNYANYNSAKWQNTLDNIINKIHSGKDFKLLDIKTIEITENELNAIKNINQEKYEKLAFVLLVYAKIYNAINENEKNWVNAEHKYIFSDAKIAVKVKDQGVMIHKLYEMGLVEPSLVVDKTNIKINFVDKDSPVVLVVSDFRNYVYEYLRWKGKNIGCCEECGILFIPTNNSHKYCKGCAKDISQEQKNKWKRENWDGRKTENR